MTKMYTWVKDALPLEARVIERGLRERAGKQEARRGKNVHRDQ